MTKSNSETTKSSGSRLRSNLLRGIAVLFPVYLTFIMIRFLIEIFSKPLAPVFRWIMKRVGLAGYPWMIEGFIIFSSFMVTLVLVITVGAVAQRVFGRRIVGFFEKILAKLPVIRTIYRAFRELTRIMTGETAQSYRKAVYVTLPGDAGRVLGFVTGTLLGAEGKNYYTVLVPTTPNITTGFLLLLEAHQIEDTHLTPEAALRLIISAGILNEENHSDSPPSSSAGP